MKFRRADNFSQAVMSANRHSGFTLIEVLITVVILSTGIVLVLQAFQTSATALGAARDAMRATHLLRGMVETIARDGLAAVPASGACPAPYGAYACRVTAAAGGGESPEGGQVQQITVDVWPQYAPSAVFSLSTYLYGDAP